MNSASQSRALVANAVRAREAASGPAALQRFDAWVAKLGGEVLEYESPRRLATAYARAESNRLDSLAAALLKCASGRAGAAEARAAIAEFHDTSVAQMRRTFHKLAFLAPVAKAVGFVLRVAALSALFVFVSEGASYLYTVHPW
ncbi:MAG: hypothetical protein EKK53_25395 [Burkholderiales bacterium]|nr:MAG: hypothetical protein EKK53_25395 [Burkholderiales bacterium]